MENLATTNITELGILLGAVFAAFGGMLLGFYKYSQDRDKLAQRIAGSEREEREMLAKAVERMASATEESGRNNVNALIKGNKEAEERNGHLGSQNLKIARLVTSQNKDVQEIRKTNKKIVDLLENGLNQHVDKQIVDHQTIGGSDESANK